MFAQISNIVGKEWRELIRDRRTLMTLIFMGLAFPAYVFFLVNMAANRSDAGVDIEAYLVGEDQAPNMVRFLEEQGVTFTRFETREAALDESNASRVLVELEDDFRKTYENSLRATVNLYVNQKDDSSAGNARQLRRFLNAYNDIVSQGRMIARGVSPVRVDALYRLVLPIAPQKFNLPLPSGDHREIDARIVGIEARYLPGRARLTVDVGF